MQGYFTVKFFLLILQATSISINISISILMSFLLSPLASDISSHTDWSRGQLTRYQEVGGASSSKLPEWHLSIIEYVVNLLDSDVSLQSDHLRNIHTLIRRLVALPLRNGQSIEYLLLAPT